MDRPARPSGHGTRTRSAATTRPRSAVHLRHRRLRAQRSDQRLDYHGHLDAARAYVEVDLPKNAFTLFLSAIATALLGLVTADEDIHEIARRWVDRPAPPIQHGAAAFAHMARALTTGETVDPAGVRAWFDDLIHSAPTSISQFATPLAATYLAMDDIPNARAIVSHLRASAEVIGDPPMHRALCDQITAMIAYANGDRAASATAARHLITTATEHGYVLLQVDGLELLALSDALPADITAMILATTRTARDRIGYRGQWPTLATDLIAASDLAHRHHPAACEHGTSLTVDAVCSSAL